MTSIITIFARCTCIAHTHTHTHTRHRHQWRGELSNSSPPLKKFQKSQKQCFSNWRPRHRR